MSVSIAVENPRKLTKESLILIGGGAVSGLVASMLHLISGTAHPALTTLAFGSVIGLFVNLSDPRAGTPMLRLVLSMLAGGLMAALITVHWGAAALVGGAFFGVAFSLDHTDLVERIFYTCVYAIALVGGMFVTTVLTPLIEVPLIANLFTATSWGIFLAFAGGLKRVKWTRDEVLAEFNDAIAELSGEERETIRNARAIYQQIARELEEDRDASHVARAREIAVETSHALIALTKRSQQLRGKLQLSSHRDLRQRIIELDDRIGAATDATVKRELLATQQQLAEQMAVHERFDVARARIEARQQRCLTALERLHIALVQADTGTDDAVVAESIESLERLADEIQWRNLSVDELVGDAPEVSRDEATRAVVAELRAQAESQPDDAVELVVEAPSTATLDTIGLNKEAGADEPPGTDGSVDSPEEQAAYARADSR